MFREDIKDTHQTRRDILGRHCVEGNKITEPSGERRHVHNHQVGWVFWSGGEERKGLGPIFGGGWGIY